MRRWWEISVTLIAAGCSSALAFKIFPVESVAYKVTAITVGVAGGALGLFGKPVAGSSKPSGDK